MAGRITLTGLERLLEMALRGEYNGGSPPTDFYVALVTADQEPTIETQAMNELVEIAAGNGYSSGGVAVARSATGFDVLSVDTSAKEAEIQAQDITWSASGGTIPSSGNGARWAVLTDDNPTIDDREILAYWDLKEEKIIPDGGSYTLEDLPLVLGGL